MSNSQVTFSYGKNLDTTTPYFAGKVYFDIENKQIWYDDPSNISKTHTLMTSMGTITKGDSLPLSGKQNDIALVKGSSNVYSLYIYNNNNWTILTEPGTWGISVSGSAAYPKGFGANGGDITWGTLAGNTTTTTGYRTIARWDSPNGGSVAFADGPMNNSTTAGKTSMQIDGYFYQEEGNYQVLDNRYMENRIDNTMDSPGYVHMKTRLVVAGNGGSYNEGIRILPAPNGWSNVYFSDNNALSGTNTNGWLLGRRGANGSNTTATTGDFTIECNNSNGVGLTLKPNGDTYIYGKNFSLGNTKVVLQYDSTNECLNFVFN